MHYPIQLIQSISNTGLRALRLKLIALIGCLGLGPAHGVDTIPGQAVAPPPGLNLFMLSYQHIELGDRYVQGDRQGHGASLELNLLMPRYTRTFSLNGLPAAFYIQPSFARADPGGSLAALNRPSGMGDLAGAFAFWPLADHQQGDYLALASYLLLPTGQYDSGKLLNIGSNRASFAQQIAGQTRLGKQWDLMLTGDIQWFADNDDYLPMHLRLSQKPLFSTQASLMYKPAPGTLLALNYYHHRGGETALNGTAQDDATRRNRLGLAFSRTTSIGKLILQYVRDLDTENGYITRHDVTARWQVAWK
jgi:hypothetical protein